MGVALAWSAAAVASLFKVYFATLRVRLVLPDGSVTRLSDYVTGAEVFALCERDALILAGAIASRCPTVLVASGRDGDRATAALEAMGCRVIRRPSQRGGAAALFQIICELQESDTALGITVDGPLGPAGLAKSGAVVCALRTERPLRVLGAAARRSLVFPNTWSGIYLPLPFTTVIIVMAHMPLPQAKGVADIAMLTERLTATLATVRAKAIHIVEARP